MKKIEKPKIPVGEWKRPEEEMYMTANENEGIYKLNIKKCLPNSYDELVASESKNLIKTLETFIVRRKAYKNQKDLICGYIDYFIEFYDTDKTLPAVYLIIKNKLDNEPIVPTVVEFEKLIDRELFKKTKLKKLVYQFVEDNYDSDITIDEKTGRRFLSDEDFTNNDAKKLFAISTFMKILIPLVDHYTNMSSVIYDNDEKDANSIDIMKEIFYTVANYRFPESQTIPEDAVDGNALISKLYKYTANSVVKHAHDNARLWEHQGGLKSVTINNKLDETIAANLINDTLFKLKFNANGTIIGYIKSSINSHLASTIKLYKYKYNPVRIDLSGDTESSDEGSAMDKLEQSLSKIDETIIVKTDKIIADFMDKITSKYEITEDEIQFYVNELSEPSEFHNKLLNYYWAKEFYCFTELKNMSIEQRTILLIVAKLQLRERGFVELPYLLTSKNKGRTTNRLLRNIKFIQKLQESELYNNIINKKYSVITTGADEILKMISFVLNNNYTYVEYNSELNGQDIEFNRDIISNELLMFIDEI